VSNDPPEQRRDAADAVTWPMRVAAAWSWRLIIVGGALFLLTRILLRTWLVVFVFVIALFLTAILHPLESRLRPHIKHKSLSALATLLIGLIVLGGIGWFVYWQISSHSRELAKEATDLVNHTRDWLETGPLHLKSSEIDKYSKNLEKTISEHQDQVISGAVSTAKTIGEAVTGLLLALLTTFYLLRDGSDIWRWLLSLLPGPSHPHLDRGGRAGWVTFGGYMRGQLLIALFHGITTTILLVILGVPLAGALGVLIFLGSFIPLIGLVITGGLAAAVALLENGAGSGIAVIIAIVILVQVEGHVLQPFVMSRNVKIHPLAVVLAVVVGTTLKGIPGALIAVPLAAFINAAIRAIREVPPADSPPLAGAAPTVAPSVAPVE
jgi:predicted PurR-regulated permease PerM